jgi:hypothetical protein
MLLRRLVLECYTNVLGEYSGYLNLSNVHWDCLKALRTLAFTQNCRYRYTLSYAKGTYLQVIGNDGVWRTVKTQKWRY